MIESLLHIGPIRGKSITLHCFVDDLINLECKIKFYQRFVQSPGGSA